MIKVTAVFLAYYFQNILLKFTTILIHHVHVEELLIIIKQKTCYLQRQPPPFPRVHTEDPMVVKE